MRSEVRNNDHAEGLSLRLHRQMCFTEDSHYGVTRVSCVRVVSQYPKGAEIRNTRQSSALSSEEPGAPGEGRLVRGAI